MNNATDSPGRVRWIAHAVAIAAALGVVYSLAVAQKDNHAATFTDRTSYHRFIHFGFPLVALDIHEKGTMPNQIATSHETSLRYPAAIANVLIGLLLAASTWWLVRMLMAAAGRPRFSLATLLVLTGGVAIFLAGATQSPALAQRLSLDLARSWPSDLAHWTPKWPIVVGFAAAALAASAIAVSAASGAYSRIAGPHRSR